MESFSKPSQWEILLWRPIFLKEHNIISPEISRKVLDEDIRARATSKIFDVGAQAKGNASVNAGVVDFEWHVIPEKISQQRGIFQLLPVQKQEPLFREKSFGTERWIMVMVERASHQFFRTWDDKPIENIPEGWITKASNCLVREEHGLLEAKFGGDIRAGAGAELGGSASVGKDGYVELGGNVWCFNGTWWRS